MATSVNKPPCIGEKYRLAENVATALALAANGILAFLVVKRSKNELQTFKHVLLLGCCVDTLFAVVSNILEIVSSSS